MADTTVFDLLYDEYFPFRLYADYMLGRSAKELAVEFSLSENWIAERIEAVRLCVEKQVRLNLVTAVPTSRALPIAAVPNSLPQSQRV
ncbi:MAG TPA: hypothetical protein VGE93_08210 [Bryobacteraceae bacterium]